jgi:hypothetical protein
MRAASLLVAVPLLVLPGCQMNERLSGTVGGAVGGGLIAAVVGASAGGVLITAAGGALAGYLVGDYLADQRERCGCSPCQPPAYQTPSYQSPCQVPYSGHPAYDAPYQTAPSAMLTTIPTVTPVAHATTMPGTGAAAEAAYRRGRAARTAEEATAAYEESLRLDPSQPAPWNALGLHALLAGDRTTARTRFEKALAVDPAYLPARHNLDRMGP